MRNSYTKHVIIAAASAGLLAGAAITSAKAQETYGTGEEEIIKKPGAQKPSTEAAPEQKQKSGQTEMQQPAPGQQEQQTGEGEQMPAPGQQEQQTGEGEQQPAPGQQEQQTGEGEQQPAPGQQEQQTGESQQQPSTETTGSIDISAEQKTEITQVFREVKADPVDIDIDVNVGVVIPRTVNLRPLPPRVIEIVPAYSGFLFFVLADGRIVIVDPDTFKVVYILVA
jgi:hypothetical protein